MPKKRSRKRPLPLSKHLVLNQYLLKLFEVDSFEKLVKGMKEHEGVDENHISHFYHFLVDKTEERKHLTNDLLLKYDQNIVKHTRKISERRDKPVIWKYFQYLSLLFTEIYLDKYFSDKERLLHELNKQVDIFNQNKSKKDQVEYYTEEDLNKLAFWNATGSGKTLLMHVNLLQYKEYLKHYDKESVLNKIILLTPNEGLSIQHEKEFNLSGIPAARFTKNGQDISGSLLSSEMVEIIDIHKLKEESGDKTIALESFEGNNLVLVDEGHRGSSGVEWKSKRDYLSEQGFSFEYSATFGQAISASKNKNLEQEYAKCIIFDYSYKHFYNDGYGKDYRIFNLQDDSNDENRLMYLTAALLSFYQQLVYYKNNRSNLSKFLIEKPLWVFVGARVNAVRTENKRDVSDIIDILQFIQQFISNRKLNIRRLDLLLKGKSGLTNLNGEDLFIDSFSYLNSIGSNAEELYHHILSELFHCNIVGASLYIDNLKGVDGELGLRVSDNEYFGVINVGDESKLLKLCEQNGFNVHENDFKNSLFHSINEESSPIYMLIGSKKFVEGWSSWRVSMMGLMNMGRNEGSEIIQLFGRGVRLKGYKFSLKRSTKLGLPLNEIPEHIKVIETLNIFGIRADYMQKFKEYLEEEGLPIEKDKVSFFIPVSKNKPSKPYKKITVKNNKNFKTHGPKPTLDEPVDYFYKNKIVVDWYPKIQAMESIKRRNVLTRKEDNSLTMKHIAFLDIEEIYFELQRFKNERTWYNLNVSYESIQKLLSNPYWYVLYIPEERLESPSMDRVKEWQEIAITLLKKYVDRFYRYMKEKWQNQYLEYTEADDSFFTNGLKVNEEQPGYEVTVNVDAETIVEKFKRLQMDINNSKNINWSDYVHKGYNFIEFNRHIYNPLIFVEKGEESISVSPVPLNEGEEEFVRRLKKFLKSKPEYVKNNEVFLFRNPARGKGLGFFEAGNFYPDFILWMVSDEYEYMSFIDPKGLRQISGLNHPKIKFSKKIKEIQERLSKSSTKVILNSFIISATPFDQLPNWGEPLEKFKLEEYNVLFLEDEHFLDKLFSKILVN